MFKWFLQGMSVKSPELRPIKHDSEPRVPLMPFYSSGLPFRESMGFFNQLSA